MVMDMRPRSVDTSASSHATVVTISVMGGRV